MIQFLALYLIRFYQRFISPYKGFSCAYRVHTGKASCSQLGYRAIRRHGLFGGLQVLRCRLACCSEVYHAHHEPRHAGNSSRTPQPVGTLRAQAGFVDCGGCDALPCDSGGCDIASCDTAGSVVDCGGAAVKGVSNAARGALECIDPCTVLDCGGCGGGNGGRRRRKDGDDKPIDMTPPGYVKPRRCGLF